MCEHLNNFFASLGKDLADSIDPIDSTRSESQQSATPITKNSFFFTPAAPNKIISIINNLKSKKAI